MSHVTFDIELEAAMKELSKLVEDDDPMGPKELPVASLLYVRYIQVYRKLEGCYDQIVHAQKRIDLRRTLEICIGRILELRHWMVYLSNGWESFDFYPVLKDLCLGPDALEIPQPRFMVDDNSAALEARNKLLASACKEPKDAQIALAKQSTMSKEVAIGIIQACERGRQSRKRIAELFKIRKMQEEELHHKHSGGEAISPDAAARKIQALARGFLERCHVKQSAEDELILIGMNEHWKNPEREKLYEKLRENMQRRKSIQALNKSNYDEAFVFANEKLQELEGQEMREIIQEDINSWLLENRDPQTGFYPMFPRPIEGGSKYILNPPPKMEFLEEGKKDKKDTNTQKKSLSVVKKVPLPAEEENLEERCPMFFRNYVIKSIQVHSNRWHDKDDSSNLSQKYDPDLLKSSLRPMIFEEVRIEVDKDTRVILKKVKKKMLAQAKALNKKETKSSKQGAEETVKFTVLDMNVKPAIKSPKDKTGQRSLESLFTELSENGIIQLCPNRSFDDYIGVDSVRTAEIDGSTITEPSMAQVRKSVMEYCVLPLASDFIHKNSPFVRSVLLYGGTGSGKTLLVHAACTSAGATFINLSPRNLDGKYSGAQLKKMVQIAFKVAKIMAPSIIYIDEVEMIFLRNRKKFKASGLKDKPSRLKTPLVKEVALLKPGDRVLFIGSSSKPQDAPLKPPNLFTLFSKRIYVPYPDYSSRVLLWRAMLGQHGAILPFYFNLSLLAHISGGYSPGNIETVCKSVLTKKRLRKLRTRPLLPEELINCLCEFMPVDKKIQQILQTWEKEDPTKPDEAASVKKGIPKKQ